MSPNSGKIAHLRCGGIFIGDIIANFFVVVFTLFTVRYTILLSHFPLSVIYRPCDLLLHFSSNEVSLSNLRFSQYNLGLVFHTIYSRILHPCYLLLLFPPLQFCPYHIFHWQKKVYSFCPRNLWGYWTNLDQICIVCRENIAIECF